MIFQQPFALVFILLFILKTPSCNGLHGLTPDANQANEGGLMVCRGKKKKKKCISVNKFEYEQGEKVAVTYKGPTDNVSLQNKNVRLVIVKGSWKNKKSIISGKKLSKAELKSGSANAIFNVNNVVNKAKAEKDAVYRIYFLLDGKPLAKKTFNIEINLNLRSSSPTSVPTASTRPPTKSPTHSPSTKPSTTSPTGTPTTNPSDSPSTRPPTENPSDYHSTNPTSTPCPPMEDVEILKMFNPSGNDTFCEWSNTYCEDEVLKGLFFLGFNLTGKIPCQLGSFTALTYLNLYGNDLSGKIPKELASMTDLERLDLYGNDLTGEIPEELSSLTKLMFMNLGGNDLTGNIPQELATLTSLFYINLGGNDLTGEIPKELASLASLQFFALGENNITGTIPTELGSILNIAYFKLSNNDLSGTIPAEFSNLRNIDALFLDGNPKMNGAASNEFCDLLTNAGDVTFPDNVPLCPCERTEQCDVMDTFDTLMLLVPSWRLDYYPDDYSNDVCEWNEVDCENGLVKNITFPHYVKGPIPCQLGSISTLKNMFLDGNRFSGEIPTELASLAELELIKLENNRLCGIPTDIGSLINLKGLDLYQNEIRSSIPSEMGSLRELTYLMLEGNTISNTIPTELGSMEKLQYLYMGGNNLSGAIPSELGLLENLGVITLEGNPDMTGTVPDEVCDSSSIYYSLFPDNVTPCDEPAP